MKKAAKSGFSDVDIQYGISGSGDLKRSVKYFNAFKRNRQIIGYIDAREIMEVAEHNGKFCSIPKHGRKFK